MSHLLAGGAYYRDEILQGYGTAALIASALLVPLLFLLYRKRAFRITATLFVSGAFPLAVYLAPRTICPHYWELILPLFLLVGVAVLAITRFSIDRRFGLALAWYTLVSMVLVLCTPPRSVSDLYGVLTRKLKTQAEKEQLEREIYEDLAAPLRRAPKEHFNFSAARLEDVINLLAEDAGIDYMDDPDFVDKNVLVSCELELSPFSALEHITKEHDLQLITYSGIWWPFHSPNGKQ